MSERRCRVSVSLVVVAVVALTSGCASSQSVAAPPDAPSSGHATERGPDAAPTGRVQLGEASYYSDKLAGHATASGEPYDPHALTAAHRTLPLGTIVAVEREDGRRVEVRINDRGPFGSEGRILDLSRRAAEELGMLRAGVAKIRMTILKLGPARAKRRRHRHR